MKAITLALLLLADSCGTREGASLERALSQLRCGMSVAEAQALAGRRVEETSNKPDLGTHRVDGKRLDAWLTFREGHLVSIITGEINGLASVRLSPKRNLCTGELTFFLSLEWTVPLEGADVFMDGKVVKENASSGIILEVSAGNHELRILKAGYKPIVKRLSLGSESQGRIDIFITDADLQQVSS